MPFFCKTNNSPTTPTAFKSKCDAYLSASQESFGTPPPSRTLLDFDLLKILSKNSGGTVFLARDKRTSQLVALKSIPKNTHSKSQFQNVISEQDIQASLSSVENPFFLPLLCSWHDQKHFYLVTEYVPGGNMALEIIRSGLFEEDRARFYIAELIVAIEELHRRRIIHRDIKPANILLTSEGHLRLADFGLAKRFHDLDQQGFSSPDCWINFEVDGSSESGSFLKPEKEPAFVTQERCGTAFFMSPEQHQGLPYSFEADEWAMGVLLYRMLTKRMPFGADFTEREAIGACVVNAPLIFHPDDKLSPAAKSLLQGMLAKDPRARMSLSEIRGHPFFSGIDWDRARKHELKAPWQPFISPPPKQPITPRPILKAPSYERFADPCPFFQFTLSRFDQMKMDKAPIPNPQQHGHVFKKIGSFLGALFCHKQKRSNPSPLYCAESKVMTETELQQHIAEAFTLPASGKKRTWFLKPLLLPDLFPSYSSSSSPPPSPSDKHSGPPLMYEHKLFTPISVPAEVRERLYGRSAHKERSMLSVRLGDILSRCKIWTQSNYGSHSENSPTLGPCFFAQSKRRFFRNSPFSWTKTLISRFFYLQPNFNNERPKFT